MDILHCQLLWNWHGPTINKSLKAFWDHWNEKSSEAIILEKKCFCICELIHTMASACHMPAWISWNNR